MSNEKHTKAWNKRSREFLERKHYQGAHVPRVADKKRKKQLLDKHNPNKKKKKPNAPIPESDILSDTFTVEDMRKLLEDETV